jgi:lysophospholipase L1-like esterase
MIRRAIVPLVLALLAVAPAARAANCDSTSKRLVPLTDLGAGLYQGVPGGLYPGGSNHRPFGHDAAGVAIASAIVPLDTLGVPDLANGRVVFVSIGMSNCTQEFSAFISKSNADPLRRATVRAIDCAVGGQAANVIANVAAPYWDSVATRLRGRGSSPLQVQVAWVKEADASPTGGFESSSDTLTSHLRRIAQNLHVKLPSLKLVYFTSRIYAGYASTALNPEPYAYESGFAVKRLIEAQIAGDPALNFDSNAGPVAAPWLAWGPYLWADGLAGRADGFTWACADFADDGTHPAASGRNKVADSLLAFVRDDHTAAPWYRVPGALGVVAPDMAESPALLVRPNPATAMAWIELAGRAEPGAIVTVHDVAGRRRRSLPLDAGGHAAWDLRDDDGLRVRPGLYWVRVLPGVPRAVRAVVVR